MEDLISFANRDDLSPVAQAAIVHAQFESIHPFTDGNGRIGRSGKRYFATSARAKPVFARPTVWRKSPNLLARDRRPWWSVLL